MNCNKLIILLIFICQYSFSQDLISEGTNRWIFHTPDDGRTSMHVAPYTNNDWQWGLATIFLDTGSVLFSGNVGIGTRTPDQKLTVKGKIHAEEIIVDLKVPADYVFQKYFMGKSELKSDYVMPTLAEIESFAKKNNHLPKVPSAKEMQKKGMSLGEMSNLLLQKVEELTLYAIEQNKELERLKAENENYKSLAERLAAIEKKLKK